MKLEKINLGETHSFSPIFLDYIDQNDALKPFYHLYPNLDHFQEQLNSKTLAEPIRQELTQVLNEQYHPLPQSEKLRKNIGALAEAKTFTITTGHQLNLFTGPMFFIYKIVTVINLCKKLQERYPDYHFVPVYWMASEDHDFAEINHFHLFNQTYTWQTEQKGPVGRFSTDGIDKVLDELPEKPEIFEKAYLEHENLATATRYLVNELFGEQGLVILNADHPRLKKLFIPFTKNDILENTSNHLVEQASRDLADNGYKNQVFSREINFFYMKDQLRERLVKEEDFYKVLNSSVTFTQEELIREIETHPEHFSPNVVTRPVYQESILPNLAYIGGPAEIAYWMQLKPVFDHCQLPFPILIPRNFGLVINKTSAKKIHKVNLATSEIFLKINDLKEKYLEQNGLNTYQLDQPSQHMHKVFDQIKQAAREIDPSLEGFIGAEENKVDKMISNIEKRLKKAEEKRQEVALRQLENIREKLFPGDGLQERTDNFLNFYLNSPELLDFLLHHFDPLDFRFNIIWDE
ncbi:MAG: bacillithiol biosynthesis cysteine-adding enzyme BshC [Candidatus Cyclobacteriaceae bacterium M3_2C_046]